MGKLEIVGINYHSNGVLEEHSRFTPELGKDLVKLIDKLPTGSKVGIECSKEIMEGLTDDSTDAIDSAISKLDRKIFFENVINKCSEKGVEVVCLLDNDLCKKGKIILEDLNYLSDISESLELGYSPQTDFEVETKNGEKIIKPYYKLEPVVRNNFNYWKFVELPDSIFKNVYEGNFDLVILSKKTLGYFARQRPNLVDYSRIDVRGVDIEEDDSQEEICRKINGVVVENMVLRKSKLVSSDLNNYPEDKIRNDFGYRPGDREKIIVDYLVTSDIVVRI